MTAKVASLWRHPIKSHGREEIAEVTLPAGQTMPFDRLWAVAHTESAADGSEWVLSALNSWGHRDFSVRAVVVQSGAVRRGDAVRMI